MPMVIDGFISSVAALCAVRLNPDARNWMLFGHQSAEYGHCRVLAELNAQPILNLNLRLGEGSGAGAALGVIQLACALHNQMATLPKLQFQAIRYKTTCKKCGSLMCYVMVKRH
jgi:nicotinate-nucleotide--dimethylbenzimidazole phosphoribosyltransferase